MPAGTATEVGEDRSTVVDIRADLHPSAAENERPALEGAGDFADQDPVPAGGRDGLDTGGEVGRSRRREAAETIERVELQLQSDLRPPGVILGNEMCRKVEPTRQSDRLDILDTNLSIAWLSSRDRGLLATKPLGKLALRQTRAATSHQDVLRPAHTKTASPLRTKRWTKLRTSSP